MNHLESSLNGKNSLWRYLLMLGTIFLGANTIGSIPLIITVALRKINDPALFAKYAENPGNLGLLGINSNFGLFMLLIPFLTGLGCFVLLIKPLHWRTIQMTVNGTGKIRWERFFISAFVWLILSASYLFLSLKIDPSNFTVNNSSKTLIGLSIISFLFIPFQATLEEVVFRGYLMQGFANLLRNRWSPLILTSVLFGLLHSFNPEVKDLGFFIMMPQYIVFGLIFGVITILDDGIEAAMGAHAANNIFLCIMVTQQSSVLKTDSVFLQQNVQPWIELSSLIVFGIIFIFILKMIFRWNDFSSLAGKLEDKSMNQIP
jgi:uncharacterized protein